ncbi:MAG: hypothetical protein WCG78_03190, partial [Candidatus Omnitrophota bacterium]
MRNPDKIVRSRRTDRLAMKCVAGIISLTMIFQDIIYAQGAVSLNPAGGGRTRAEAVSESVTPPVSIIPYDSGTVAGGTDRNEKNQEMIFNIQDAHTSVSAQLSIAKILGSLVERYQMKIIALEGSEGFIDTSVLSAFPDRKIKEDAADFLLREGKISAGEFFAITNGQPVALYGIEESGLYIKNVEVFRGIIARRETDQKNIQALTRLLEALKEKIYSSSLLELDRRSEEFDAQKSSLDEYVGYLMKCAGRSETVDAYQNLSILFASRELEKEIDFGKADEERKEVIERLSLALTGPGLEALVKASVDFKTGKISPAVFHSYLLCCAAGQHIDFSGYKNFIRYARYLDRYSRLNFTGLFEELGLLKAAIKESLFRNETERTLSAICEKALLVRDLFETKLTAPSLAKLRAALKESDLGDIARFIAAHCGTYHISYAGDIDIGEFSKGIACSLAFYEAAEKRNAVIFANTIERMRSKHEKVAALVTGGFHTGGLVNIFNDQQISYLIIVPRLDPGTPGERPYVTILTNKTGSYIDSLRDNKNLALFSFFSASPEITQRLTGVKSCAGAIDAFAYCLGAMLLDGDNGRDIFFTKESPYWRSVRAAVEGNPEIPAEQQTALLRLYDALADRNNSVVVRTAAGEGEGVELYLNVPGYGIYGFSAARNSDGRTTLTPISGVTAESFAVLKRRSVSQGEGIRPSGYAAAVEEILADPEQVAELSGRFTAPFEERADWGHALTSVLLEAHGVAQAELSSERVTAARRVLLSRAHDNKEGLVVPWGDPDLAWLEPLAATSEAGPANAGQLKLREQFFRRMDTFVQEHLSAVSVDGRFSEEAFQSALTDDCGYRSVRGLSGVEERVSAIRQEIETRIAEQLRPAPAMAPTASAEEPSAKMARISPATRRELLRTICAKTESLTVAQAVEALPMMLSENGQVYGERAHFAYSTVAKDLKYLHDAGELERHASMTAVAGASGNLLPVRTFHYQRVVPALVAPVAAGPERVAVAPAPLVPASLLTNTAALPPADLFPAANVPVPLRSVASERPKRRARLSEAARRRRERKRTLTLEPLGGRLAITGVPGALVPDHIPGEEVVHSGSANATAHATIHIDKSVSTVRELPLLSKFFSGANVSVVIDINTVTVDIDRADLEKYVNEIRAGQKAHYADMREHTYVVISLELDPVDQKGRGSSVDVIKVSFADIESALKQTAGQQYVPFSRPSDPALYNLHVPPRAAVRLASETSKIAENRTLLGIASFKPHGSQAVAANKVATVQKSGGGGHAEAAHGGGGHGARKTTAPEKAKKHKILPKEKEEPPDVNKDEVKKEEGVRPEEVDTALADLLADEGGEFDMLALYETTDSTPGLDESSASAQAAAAALPIDTAEQRKRKGGQENGSARGFLKGLGWFAISAAALYEMVRRVRRSTAEDAAVAGSRDEAAIAAAMAELDQLQNGEAAPSWVRPAAKAAAVVVLCAVGCLWKMHMSHQGAVDPTSLDQTVPLMGMAGPMLGVFGSNLSPNNRRAALRDAKHRLNRAEKAVKRLRRAGASESQIDQARQVVSELRDNYELLRETSQRPSSSWVRNGAIVLLSAALWIAAFAGVFLPMTARHWAKDVEVPTVRSRAGVPEAVPPATPQGDEHQLQKMPDGTRPTLQGPPDDKEELDRLRKDSFFNNLLEREYDPVTARLEEELQKELIKQLGFKQSQAKSKTQRLQHEAEIAKVNKQMTEVSAEIARLTGLGKVYHFSKQWAANSLRVMRDINKRSPNSIADLDEMWHTLEVRLGTAATNEEVAAILTEAQEKLRPALEAEIAARRSGIAEADEAIELAQQGIVFSKNTTIPRIKSQIAQLGERLRGICAAIVQGKHGRQVALQVELVNHFTRTRDVNACDAMAAALGALETVFLNWYDNEEDRSGYLQVRGALHEYFTAIARRGGKTAATAALTKVQQERRSANQLSLVDMAIADTLAVLGVKTPPFFKVSTRAESIPVLSGSYVNDSPGKWSLRHKLVDQQKHIPDLPGHEPVLGLRAAAYQEICAALKNPVDFKRLLAAITDPDPVRRANAVQVCGTRPELAPLLTAVAAHETDLHVLEMCAAGLGAIEPAVSMPNLQDPRAPGFNRLSGLTGAETNNIRALAAFDWLTTVDDAQFAAAVSRILKEDTDELVQLGAILAAQQRPDPRLLKPLLEYLAPNTPSFYQLWAPASGFGSLFDEANRAVELIVQNHPEDTVVRNAVTDLQSASMGNPGLFVNGAGRLTHIRAPQDFWAPGEETFVWRPDTWTMLAIHFLWQMGVPVAVLNFLLWFVLRPRASADRRLDRWNLPALLLHLRTTQPPVLDHAASFTPAPFDRVPASESHATVDTASDRINNVWAVLPDYQAALSCWRTSLAQGRPLSREAVDAAGLIVVRIFTQLEAPWDHSRSLPHERDRLEAMQALLILHIGLLADQRRSLGQSSSQGTASGDAEALFLSDRERHAIDYLEYFRTYSSLIDAMSLLTMYLDSSNLRRAYLWAYGYNGLRDDALAFAGSLEDRFDQCRNACYENAALPGRATSSYRGRTQGWFDCELMGRRQRATVSVGDLAPRQLEEARQRHERSSTGGWLENSLRRLWTRDLTAFGLPVLGLGLYITLGGGYYEFVNATTGDIPSLLWFLFKTPISVGLGFLGATFIHRRQHSQMCRKIEERYRTRDEQIARLRRSASLGSGVPAYTQEYLGARRRDAAAVSRLRGATFAADCAQYAQQVGQLGRSDRMPVLIVATGSHGPAERERIREMLGGPHFDTTLIICVDDTFDGAVPLNDI